jgi:hypothetical protein
MELKKDINKEHHEIMMMNLKVVDVFAKDSFLCLKYFINNIKYLHFLQIPFFSISYLLVFTNLPFFQFDGHLFQFNADCYNIKAFPPFWFYLMFILVFMHSPMFFLLMLGSFFHPPPFFSIRCLLVFTHSQFIYVYGNWFF